MQVADAVYSVFRNRRFWVWQLAGAAIYAIPVIIRYSTGDVVIPILNWPGFWIYHFIPGNLLEKILVNAFFPGGAGAVSGEVFVKYYKGGPVVGRAKYLYRLGGAMVQTVAWSALQFGGYFLMIAGPSGANGSNLFESVFVFPINFILAAFSIFTPTVVEFVSKLIKKPLEKS